MSNSTESGFIQRSLNGWGTLTRALDALQPLAAFLARAPAHLRRHGAMG